MNTEKHVYRSILTIRVVFKYKGIYLITFSSIKILTRQITYTGTSKQVMQRDKLDSKIGYKICLLTKYNIHLVLADISN